MGKRAIWLEDDLEERLKAVHEAMQKDPVLRNLRLKWADALKLLLRDALDSAQLDYMGTLPDNVDPEEALQVVDEQYRKRRAILEKMIADGDAKMIKQLSRKKRGADK
jgi:hypothetical protein